MRNNMEDLRGDRVHRRDHLLSLNHNCNRFYLMNHVVIVLSFSPWFDLVKVHYEGDSVEFFVDIQLLSLTPDNTCTINLNLFGGAS